MAWLDSVFVDAGQWRAGWPCQHGWLVRALTVSGFTIVVFLFSTTPAQAHTVLRQATPGATDPFAGLIRDINLCGTGFLIEGTDLCTHGPDFAFPNLALTELSPITCDGDGVSGKRVQVMYVRTLLDADHYDENLALFRRFAAEVNQAVYDSAQETGGGRQVRFVTDAACQVDVLNVVMPPVVDLTFQTMILTLRLLGYNDPDRKYLMFVDADLYCGIGTVINDDSPGNDNRSNRQAGFARVDRSCWSGSAATHELVHTLGGVQQNAPNTSGGWHCTDEWDVMCYSDAPNYPSLHYICPLLHDLRLDCNHDDYFHTNPPAGSYLATHWNVANSAFLLTPNLPPSITISTPGNTLRFKRPATITVMAEATDPDGAVASVIFFKNAARLASVTTPPYQFTWTEATSGNLTITAIAYDDKHSATTSAALELVVEDPENQAPAVSIATLTGSTVYTAPATITVIATASDSDGAITQVEFYDGETWLIADSTEPYRFSWLATSAQTYSIRAKAYDNRGGHTTSAPLTVTVMGPPSPAPGATPTPSLTALPTAQPPSPTATPSPTPTRLPDDAATTIQPGQPATLTYQATDGRGITLQVPAGAVDKPTTLVYHDQATPTQPTAAPFEFAWFTFLLTGFQDNQAVAGFTFLQPVTLTVTYADADVAELDESQLALFFFDTATGQWSRVGITVLQRDVANNRLTLQITHLAEFALGTPNSSVYLPLVSQQP